MLDGDFLLELFQVFFLGWQGLLAEGVCFLDQVAVLLLVEKGFLGQNFKVVLSLLDFLFHLGFVHFGFLQLFQDCVVLFFHFLERGIHGAHKVDQLPFLLYFSHFFFH